MRKLCVVITFTLLLTAGCEHLRFAPGEIQKANAYLHHRTAQMAADAARDESVSPELEQLTALSAIQSRAFMADYGLPKELPAAETVADVLAEPTRAVAAHAITVSAERPDPWAVADGLFEAAIGIAGLIGGAYGIRAVQFLKRTRQTSLALREIIRGNEAFKRAQADAVPAFKHAHQNQSPSTRQLVTELKAE
ncbi:MAG TPA: hypothetical protein P5279_00230 [Anaerohalosphaeraceae bacterium]|jgi:hypothetical protein|nr:hypothetical protein [Anaerohalosphaeraceae bacterium]HRT48891.1 hypothetical protein [Anaerohalosphaeraceae bacterium]HRT85014.1 hypothetical protein [Anaerohalosphaeraceae bacterium]